MTDFILHTYHVISWLKQLLILMTEFNTYSNVLVCFWRNFWCPPPPFRVLEDLGFKGSRGESRGAGRGAPPSRRHTQLDFCTEQKGQHPGENASTARCGGKGPRHPPGGQGWAQQKGVWSKPRPALALANGTQSPSVTAPPRLAAALSVSRAPPNPWAPPTSGKKDESYR